MQQSPTCHNKDTDDDDSHDKLDQKILHDEVDFPEDMSLAAILIVLKVIVIAIQSEALKCHSLLYALECKRLWHFNAIVFYMHLNVT